jgi:hypothetical protein
VGWSAHAPTCKALLPRLRQHVPDYDKTRVDFLHYAGGRDEAGARARRLAAEGEEHRRNPATGVWALVDRIASPAADDAAGRPRRRG